MVSEDEGEPGARPASGRVSVFNISTLVKGPPLHFPARDRLAVYHEFPWENSASCCAWISWAA